MLFISYINILHGISVRKMGSATKRAIAATTVATTSCSTITTNTVSILLNQHSQVLWYSIKGDFFCMRFRLTLQIIF